MYFGSLKASTGGLVTGVCRTIRSENPNTNIATLVIEDWTTPRTEVVSLFSDVFERSFYTTVACIERDTGLAEKSGLVCIPRYRQAMAMDNFLDREFRPDIGYLQLFSPSGRPLELTISKPGFRDTLCFVDDEQAAIELADGEIEIDIKALGLKLKDEILALGQLAGN